MTKEDFNEMLQSQPFKVENAFNPKQELIYTFDGDNIYRGAELISKYKIEATDNTFKIHFINPTVFTDDFKNVLLVSNQHKLLLNPDPLAPQTTQDFIIKLVGQKHKP